MDMEGTLILHIKSEVLDMISHNTLAILKHPGYKLILIKMRTLDNPSYKLLWPIGFGHWIPTKPPYRFYVPSISINLISLSCLDNKGFVFIFRHGMLKIYKNDIYFGCGYGCDGLYKLSLDLMCWQSILNMNIWIKRRAITPKPYI